MVGRAKPCHHNVFVFSYLIFSLDLYVLDITSSAIVVYRQVPDGFVSPVIHLLKTEQVEMSCVVYSTSHT